MQGQLFPEKMAKFPIVDRRLDVNIRGWNDWTPLIWAAFLGTSHFVPELKDLQVMGYGYY